MTQNAELRLTSKVRINRFLFMSACVCTIMSHSTTDGQVLKLGSKAGVPRVNTAVGYELDASWPSKGEAPEWGELTGIAVDENDNVWVLHRGETPVYCFAPDGRRKASWGQGLFGTPHQIRIDRDGSLWIADAGLHIVRKFTT